MELKIRKMDNVCIKEGAHVEKLDKNFPEKIKEFNRKRYKKSEDNVIGESGDGVMLFPKPGDLIEISRGVDLPNETAKVYSRNTWSREYSVVECNNKFKNELCCNRLNYAIENYPNNNTENDLLVFELDGYDKEVYAGAMVEGYADIGDVVQVTLDDNNYFYFLILDEKSVNHTSQQLDIYDE